MHRTAAFLLLAASAALPSFASSPGGKPSLAEKKVHRSAIEAASVPALAAPLTIVFRDGVEFEEARALVHGAGGSLDDVLQTRFRVGRRIAARIPAGALIDIASDERVRQVHGTRKLRVELHNARSALLSGVDVVQAAPYGLTGEGVAVSFMELAPADASHQEFQGRLQVRFTCEELFPAGSDERSLCENADNKYHATHVAGTIAAAGSPRSDVKGMAPKATVHQFNSLMDDFLESKRDVLPGLKSVADNNSWGYVLGWRDTTWHGNDDLLGGYFYENAALDLLARCTLDQDDDCTGPPVTLLIHSAGNTASQRGPAAAPFHHSHGDTDESGYCYTADGSGNDCTSLNSQCRSGNDSKGRPYCENAHPAHAPWRTIGVTASSKNTLAVGATDENRVIASYSSRGPTVDGRVKPELVARGGLGAFNRQVVSTTPGNGYGGSQGTSMATPVVTGISALLTEQWRKLHAGVSPHPSVLKALLIAGASDLGNPGPDYTYGFGFVDAKSSADLIIADNGNGERVKFSTVKNGESIEFPVTATAGQKLRVVLNWADPEVLLLGDELAEETLVNDLDVKLIDPAGSTALPYVLDRNTPEAAATRGVNVVDNTEMLEIDQASGGTYRVVVTGRRIDPATPAQEFALVANAAIGAGAIQCVDIGEPNNSADAAYVIASPNRVERSRACTAGDVDFFRFFVNAAGNVSASVTASDTPLNVALFGASGAVLAEAQVAANTTRTVTAFKGGSGNETFVLRIEPAGTVGPDGTYSVSTSYNVQGGRRRSVRR